MKQVRAIYRFWFISTLTVTMQLSIPFANTLCAWSNHWWTNRSSILMFTCVNTAITTVSEAGVRNLTSPFFDKNNHSFFIINERGEKTIHQQSVINILMTLFASLIGGPVYFMRRGYSRFLFFTTFGSFNSLISQGVASLFRLGFVQFAFSRLLFDFIYNATIKFAIFEIGRRPILKRKKRPAKFAVFRTVQDFLTTTVRVAILNLIGLKG